MMMLVACEGVVGSLVLLCGERSVQEETLHWAGPFVLMLCSSGVQTPETLEINFVNGTYLWMFLTAL